ncbi:hypothetical protein B0T09DRAFT_62507 [Sordaria sp. MPI-SDFR-AT-0083]|nr:hypothetical protein B0T09DRAFT_62507 [Sordaria sp. MPI-SDFR-AT-0083]
MPFPGTTVLCVPHLPLGYRSRVPFCPFVLADSAGLLPGWDIIPSQRTRCNRAPTWTSALHHRFPISCDPALSFVPEPHHLTWLYPPLSCLGYCVWNPHKPHLLPGYHHALWPNCPTSATSNFQPNQASHAALAQAERIQHPHSSIGSRFRKGGHLWIAIRPVRPAHRLQNKSYADNACRLPVTNQRQGLELLLGGKDIVFLQIRERKDSPTTSISQSHRLPQATLFSQVVVAHPSQAGPKTQHHSWHRSSDRVQSAPFLGALKDRTYQSVVQVAGPKKKKKRTRYWQIIICPSPSEDASPSSTEISVLSC